MTFLFHRQPVPLFVADCFSSLSDSVKETLKVNCSQSLALPVITLNPSG